MLNIWSVLSGDVVSGVANASQIYDLALNLKQVSNDELMKELELQDKLYLTKCIEQNEYIIQQNQEIIDKLNILLQHQIQIGEANVE